MFREGCGRSRWGAEAQAASLKDGHLGAEAVCAVGGRRLRRALDKKGSVAVVEDLSLQYAAVENPGSQEVRTCPSEVGA